LEAYLKDIESNIIKSAEKGCFRLDYKVSKISRLVIDKIMYVLENLNYSFRYIEEENVLNITWEKN
jgi:hypothetical protein